MYQCLIESSVHWLQAQRSLWCGAVAAQSITYSGADFTSSGLGADFPAIYDQFNYPSLPGGPLDVSNPASANIGLLTFVVGVNCTTCA